MSNKSCPVPLVLLSLAPGTLWAANAVVHSLVHSPAPSTPIFLAQVIVLLVCGRLMGELMSRIGQSAVMGQLIAGILLGPSVLGAILPGVQHLLFPPQPEQKAMIDAVGELGILLLLLLTGMETDLVMIRRSGRAAFTVSIAGIAVPFLCGVLASQLLPDSLMPDPQKRLVTTLFLGTALSISSVKIVALIVRELGFLRRTVGQVIVAAAVVDDAIGWIIMSVTFGLAIHGGVDVATVSRSVIGTLVFLVVSFTVGRRIVFQLIRWANDSFVSELPVITMLLAVTGAMALLTNAIGVHTVLGAFVAGILVGQSPILTRHIDEQLRGLIVALFMPVFFGLAGLSTDVSALAKPDMLLLTIGLIAVASVGKFSGALLGGRLGGLTLAQSLAAGCGMNARGSTEVIIASIGLSVGVLNQNLFTAIVAMAIVTTMAMPPMLRWALARLPMTPEEEARIRREELEARTFVPNIERLLVAVDASPSGQFASHLAGLFAGVRRIPTTALYFDDARGGSSSESSGQAGRTETVLKEAAESGGEARPTGEQDVDITLTVEEPAPAAQKAITSEARKGYGLLFIGREPATEGDRFCETIARSAAEFGGAFAITVARGEHRRKTLHAPLRILVPLSGTAPSRHGAELAIALAQASKGSITALHTPGRAGQRRRWRERFGVVLESDSAAEAIIRHVVELGNAYGVPVEGAIRSHRAAENAIQRELRAGRHNLLVMGVSPRPGDQLFLGELAAGLLEREQCSLLLVASERFER